MKWYYVLDQLRENPAGSRGAGSGWKEDWPQDGQCWGQAWNFCICLNFCICFKKEIVTLKKKNNLRQNKTNPKPLKCELHLNSSSDSAWRQTKQNSVARMIITLFADFPNTWNINTTVPKLIQEMLPQTLHLNKIKPKNLRTNRKCFRKETMAPFK